MKDIRQNDQPVPLSCAKAEQGKDPAGIKGRGRPQKVTGVGAQTGSGTRKRTAVGSGENINKAFLLNGIFLFTLIA